MKRRAKILLPIVVLLFGAGLAAAIVNLRPRVERREVPAPAPLVRAVTVEPQDLLLSIRSQGTIVPGVESVLAAQVAGKIDWVSPQFAVGGQFRRGTVLARIEDSDYRLALSRAEAEVARAQTRLDLELAEADQALRDWQELGRGEPTALTLREPQTAEARASLQAAEASVEQARIQLSRTRIAAPYNGRLRRKLVDLGQFVAPGTPLIEIFSTEYAEIELPVAKRDLEFLRFDLADPSVSDPTTVELSGELGGTRHTWSAKLVRAGGEFDPRTRMLSLFARIKDPFAKRAGAESAALPMGLFVDAEIEGKTIPGAVLLPRSALRDRDRLLVIDEESRLRFRDVEVVRLDREDIVIGSGIEAGERVCVSPLETVVDGMTVRIAEPESAGESPDRELL
ncbi:MAG: efflux RND transporter periplasmic adaptor subunit [Acidobacteriota bacterium]|nr:efflux RND transporter periplasmic adaptor subunit [Acidobacteriota bacterium]